MKDDREQWVQQRAYAIWEAEGRPDGRDREHWEQAERELPADDGLAAVNAARETSTAKKPRKRTATKSASSTARSGKKKAAELHP